MEAAPSKSFTLLGTQKIQILCNKKASKPPAQEIHNHLVLKVGREYLISNL